MTAPVAVPGLSADAFVQTVTSDGQTFTAYTNGPYLCFKGDLSAISNFWTGGPTPSGCGRHPPHPRCAQR